MMDQGKRNTLRMNSAIMIVVVTAMIFGIGSAVQAADKVVRIGNIIPLSGPSASVGQQGKNAREMAVEEINAAGGIKSLGGAKLEMIYADSESKPEKGVAEAERLINSEKVNLLTGCWNSAVTYPTTAVAERYGIPFIVPVSVSDKITEQGFKTVFRIAAKDSWWTRDQFVFLKDMQAEFGVDLKSVAFVYENGDWGKGFAEQWKELAQKAGFEVVMDEPYPSTTTDLSPVVQKIRRARPDVLLLVSNAADAILLTNTLAEYKVKVKAIIGSGGGHADPSFLDSRRPKCAFYLRYRRVGNGCQQAGCPRNQCQVQFQIRLQSGWRIGRCLRRCLCHCRCVGARWLTGSGQGKRSARGDQAAIRSRHDRFLRYHRI